MHPRSQISLTRKSLYTIILLAIFLSAFGMRNLPSAFAQDVDTETPITTMVPSIPTIENLTESVLLALAASGVIEPIILEAKINSNWGLVRFTIDEVDEPGIVVAQWINNDWDVALGDSERYLEWMPLLPNDLITDEEKAYILPSANITALSVLTGYKLPYPGGTAYSVTQGNNGSTSHSGSQQYAFDFDLNTTSEPIMAARSGRVYDLRETQGTGKSAWYTANFIVIVHEPDDGYADLYLHVNQNSVIPNIGESVVQGQPIAMAGHNGNSTGAHLHFQVENRPPKRSEASTEADALASWWTASSISVQFLDSSLSNVSGVPLSGNLYESSGITLYEHFYDDNDRTAGGRRQTFIGYIGDLNNTYLKSDVASSIRVASGWSAMLWKGINKGQPYFRAKSFKRYFTDEFWSDGTGLDNSVRSLQAGYAQCISPSGVDGFAVVPSDIFSQGGGDNCDPNPPPTCYPLNLYAQGSGAASSNPHTSSCGFLSFPPGTNVQLNATPYAGWHFDHWTGASGGASTNYTVNGSATVIAVFAQDGVILPPPTEPPPPASGWNQTFFSDSNLSSQCGSTRNENDVYMFRDSETGWGPPSGCPGVESPWSVRMVRSDAYFQGGTYEFGMFYDDGARLFMDGNSIPIVDGWTATQHYESHYVTPGNHELKLEYKNNAGHAIVQLWWRGPGALPGNNETQDPNQWWVNYWGNQTQWQDSVGRRNEGTGFLNHDWGNGGPGFGIPSDHFSTRYERTVGFECGTYRFHLSSDDGSRLSIDGAIVPTFDHWITNTWDTTADIYLQLGDHILQVDSFENGGGARVYFDWSPVSYCPPTTLDPPSDFGATKGFYTEKVLLAWTTSTGATQYEIWRNTTDSSGSATHIADYPAGNNIYSDTTAIPGTIYYYWVKACNASVCSNFSNSDYGYRSGGGTGLNCDQVSYTGVILYEQANCNKDMNGVTKAFSSSTGWIDIVSDFNDITSSIYVSPGWSIKVFEAATFDLYKGSYGGSWICITGSMWNLNSDKYTNVDANQIIDNTISSVQVYNNGVCSNAPVNILYNGGFEEGTTSPTLWSQDAWNQTPTYTTFIWDTVRTHSGNRSVEIANSHDNDARWIQTVYVQPNSNYRLSGWIRTQIVAQNGGRGANLSILDPSISTNKLFGTNDWTYVSVDFNTGSKTDIQVAARLGMYAGEITGIAWFDDLKLELLSTPICYTLTKNANPSGSAAVTANPPPNCNNGTQYVHGTQVTLTAEPNSGYSFTNWTGATALNDNPTTVAMTGNKSVVANIALNIPNIFNKSDPTNGSTNQSINPTLTWSPSSGATSYEYCYDTTNNNTCTTWINNGVATAKILSGLTHGATYYWHVRAKNAGGITYSNGSATEFWSFTTIGLPSVPILISPINGAISTDYAPSLDWNDQSLSLDHYQLQLATTSTFTVASTLYDQNTTNSDFSIPTDLTPGKIFYWRVRALNSLGQSSAWSATRSLKTGWLAPSLISPSQNEQMFVLRPSFDWSDIPGATGYTIQISTNGVTFATPMTGNTVVSNFTPTVDLKKNVTLYWRVQTKGVNGPSAWSEIRPFNSPNPPATPVLSLPASNALLTDYTPLLKWSIATLPAGTAFDHYQVQVAVDAAFSNLVTDVNITGISNFLYTIPSDLDSNTKYYWRVRAVNSAGGASNWSAVRYFRTIVDAATNLSVSPVNGLGTALSLRPTFDWDTVAGPAAVTGYTIQISKNSTFTMIVHTGNSTTSSYVPTADLPKGVSSLWWRVQTKGANGPSAWSTASSFNSANSPTTPVLSLPASNALNTNYIPLFKWTAVTLPVGTSFKNYQLQVDDSADFSSPALDNTSIADRLTIQFQTVTPLAYNTKFYWRVRAVNTDNEAGNWSAIRYFRTAMLPPILISPASNSTLTLIRPPFDWQDVTGPTNYTIQVSRYSNFSTLLVNATAVNSTYIPVANLPKTVVLYWRVRANGSNGPSLWSDTRYFVIQ